MDRGVGQLQAPVAAHRVDDVDEQRLRDGVAGEADERVDDLLGVVPRGARVPQRQRGDAVGVDVLGGAFQLGERSDRRAGLRRRPGGRPRAAGSCRTGRSAARRPQCASFLRPLHGPERWSASRLGERARQVRAHGAERHAGGARGGERSVERATLLHRERTHAAPIIPGSPGHRPPRAGVSRPEWSRVGSAGRPTRPDEKVATVPPMTPTLPAHAPSFSVPVLRRPAIPASVVPSTAGPSSTAAEHTSARRVRKPSVRRVTVRPDVIGSRRVVQEQGDVGVTSTETGPSWSERLNPRNWPLVWKLVIVGLVPALLALVLGVLRVADQAQHGRPIWVTANGLLEVRSQRRGHGGRAARRARPGRRCSSPSSGLGDRGRARQEPRARDGRRRAEQARDGLADARRSRARQPRPRCRRPRAASHSCPCCAATSRGSAPAHAGQVVKRYTASSPRSDVLDRALLRQLSTPEVTGLADALDGRHRGVRAARAPAHGPRRRHARRAGDRRRPGGRQRPDNALRHRLPLLPCSRSPRPRRRSTSAPRRRTPQRDTVQRRPSSTRRRPGPIPVTPQAWDDAYAQPPRGPTTAQRGRSAPSSRPPR